MGLQGCCTSPVRKSTGRLAYCFAALLTAAKKHYARAESLRLSKRHARFEKLRKMETQIAFKDTVSRTWHAPRDVAGGIALIRTPGCSAPRDVAGGFALIKRPSLKHLS